MTRLLLLYGAIRNVGDFLIKDQAEQLLRRTLPDFEIVPHPRWANGPIPDADVAIVGGGPTLAPDMITRIQPNIPELLRRGTPIVPLAVGWDGKSDLGAVIEPQTKAALGEIAGRIGSISVRDEMSAEFLERIAPGTALMTGCVAWYRPDLLGRPLGVGRKPEVIVVTAPANIWLQREAISALRVVRRIFPSSEIVYSFHRGLRPSPGTSWRMSAAYLAGATAARALGATIYDASGGVEKLQRYGESQLHIGYRVHAHLYFLSNRKPSILIAEDGRGSGQQVTLGDPHQLRARDRDLTDRLEVALRTEAESDFCASRVAVETIDTTWPIMEGFISSIRTIPK